jgi:hypothetical protein
MMGLTSQDRFLVRHCWQQFKPLLFSPPMAEVAAIVFGNFVLRYISR